MDNLDMTYSEVLSALKNRIANSRYEAARAVNKELILLYWDIGHSILQKLSDEAWGGRGYRETCQRSSDKFSRDEGIQLSKFKI